MQQNSEATPPTPVSLWLREFLSVSVGARVPGAAAAKGTKKEKTQPQPAQVQVIQTTVVETFSARASARGSDD